jgi:deoxycytidylate deaminase
MLSNLFFTTNIKINSLLEVKLYMEALKIVPTASQKKKDAPLDMIAKRRTQEQIVAIAGAIGSGLPEVSIRIEESFKKFGYTVIRIKASDLILEAIKSLIDSKRLSPDKFKIAGLEKESSDRIRNLQDMGDYLRASYGLDIVSQLFIKKISADRQAAITDEEAEKGEAHKVSRPFVWILDSLKHPEEVKLLRAVYDKMFSLFGVLCPFEAKKHNLVNQMGLREDQAIELIKRDESEDIAHGQKLIKTLQFGDFFLRSSQYETERQIRSIERFVKILLGDHSVTPTHGEYAMYLAQSAAYRSGCMSRQVGAAVMNRGIVATGFNDVPQAGGGLYTEDSEKDARCFVLSGNKCRNDFKKSHLKEKLKEFAASFGATLSNDNMDTFFEVTGLNDLTEYCRAVHAEMDAITSAARKGISLLNGTMYVTTYPCHNCAKHIISSGIKKVYYIEPYEKSQATALHDDSICTYSGCSGVEFLPFEGVAPSQYQNRFRSMTSKKADGKFVKIKLGEETAAYAQLLDCFVDYEVKIVDILVENGL